MSPDGSTVYAAQQAIGLWTELGAAYDAIERRLGAGAWDGFAELTEHVGDVERRLQPLLATIIAARAERWTPAPEIAGLFAEIDATIEALARRRQQLERAAVAARNTTAARLARARIARSRAAGYTPLNPLTPRITSRRV